MKNRVPSILLAVMLALSIGLIGCASEEVPEITEYNLTVSSTDGGLVTTPGEGAFTYDEGKKVRLTAKPDEGCHFVDWTGDVGTVANVSAASTTIAMNGNYSVVANFEQEELVTFPDPNLEKAIRVSISKPTGPIYYSDLQGLTLLASAWMDVANLTGLERCTNLEYLYLSNNQISDISLLANLIHLAKLHLGWNQISDISPLTNLTGLWDLVLDSNQISDISGLASLTNLKNLFLAENQISDIAPLCNFSNLEDLDLSYNQIIDISCLTNLPNLHCLYFDSNRISDISPLAHNDGLAAGDVIELRENPLSSDSINIYIPQLQARGVTVWH